MTVFYLKDRNRWVAKFQFRHQTYRQDTFLTKSAAKAWIEETRTALKNGIYRAPDPTQTHITSFASLASDYLDHCKINQMAKNTRRAKLRCYQLFLWFTDGDFEIDQTPKKIYSDFLAYVVQNPFKNADGHKTANRYLRDLNALYNWAANDDRIVKNPLRGIKPFAEARPIKYVPPFEDINKVILAADPEETDRLICLQHLAARIGEVRLLLWEDVNLEKRQVRLWTRKRRGGEKQFDWMSMTVELHATFTRRWKNRHKQSAYVFCQANGEPYTRDMWSKRMIGLCRRAGVTPFGYHAIRHHVASLLRDSGKATIGEIQKFLRHQRMTTTENYLHELTPERKKMSGLLDNLLVEKKRAKK